MAITLEQQIAAHEEMLANAYEALKQLSQGAQNNVSVGDKSYSFEDRASLMDFASRLERKIRNLKTPKRGPFTRFVVKGA